MTTAKPQQMVGQTDSADDLIAELARLMAQDTPSEKAAPAAPRPVSAPQAGPSSPVRIPGMQSPPPAATGETSPVPRFQFGPAPVVAAPAAPAAAAPQAPQKAAEPDPFSFDFGLSTTKREPQPARVEPAPRAAEPTPRPPVQAPQAPVVQAPVVSAAPQSAPAPVEADAHDTIADLITAELNQSSASARAEAPVQAPVVTQAAEPIQPMPRPAPEAAVPLRTAAPAAGRSDHAEPTRPALRPVNLTPIARPEGDKFRIAPVFGLGTNPPAAANNAEPVRSEARPVEPQASVVAPVAPPQIRQEPVAVAPEPVASNDPIEDIESLIGRAVRVNVGQPAEPPAPSPALRSLATPTLTEPPRVASERIVASADEAILAAAAATGAEVGWVNPADARPSGKAPKPEKQAKVKAPRAAKAGLMRAFLGPVVAICLLLVAGFGLYWVLGLGNTSGPAPVLVADTSPIKQVAAVQPEATQAQQSVVFNEIDGVEPGANEQLVSRDQADVNEVTRIVTPDVNSDGVANRKVRTVTVRPDGSIVSGDDAVAGAAMLPVDRPSVPEVPGAQTASPELLAAASATQVPAAPVAPVTPTAPAVIPVVPGSNVSVVDAAGNAVAGRTAPVPFQRPASIGNAAPSQPSPVNAVVDPIGAILQPTAQTAVQASTGQSPQVATAPAPAAAAPAAAPVTNAAAYAQLASQRSEADAQATLDILNRRYGLLFNGSQLQIQRADLGERGIYYRVLLPTSSREMAADLCSSVKSNGDDCLVM